MHATQPTKPSFLLIARKLLRFGVEFVFIRLHCCVDLSTFIWRSPALALYTHKMTFQPFYTHSLHPDPTLYTYIAGFPAAHTSRRRAFLSESEIRPPPSHQHHDDELQLSHRVCTSRIRATLGFNFSATISESRSSSSCWTICIDVGRMTETEIVLNEFDV